MNFSGRLAIVLYFEFYNCFNISKLQIMTHEKYYKYFQNTHIALCRYLTLTKSTTGEETRWGKLFENIFSSFLKYFWSFLHISFKALWKYPLKLFCKNILKISFEAFWKNLLKLFAYWYMLKLFANIFQSFLKIYSEAFCKYL